MIEYKEFSRNLRIVSEKNETFHKAKLVSSKDCYQYVRKFYYDDIDIYESMFIVLLNQANNTIGWVKISQGSTTGTVCDIKIILKYAIDKLANNIIICHNHPSGNLIASDADKNLTKKLKTACSYMDIGLLDHLILADDSYMSFADDGLL